MLLVSVTCRTFMVPLPQSKIGYNESFGTLSRKVYGPLPCHEHLLQARELSGDAAMYPRRRDS
jgi:hypothetical protein